MIAGLFVIVVCGIIFVLAVLLSMVTTLFVLPALTCTGVLQFASGDSGATCDVLVCYTGPTGSVGSAAPTGLTGAVGHSGPLGIPFLVESFGPLTDTGIALIESLIVAPETFNFNVTTDLRSDLNDPPNLFGDQTRNVVQYNGLFWTNEGIFGGPPGSTGVTGARGATGFDGMVGAQGARGPTGFTGANGATGLEGAAPFIACGSMFGDANSLGFPANLNDFLTTTWTTSTTLTGDAFYDFLTINPGVVVKTNGYRIFARNQLTHNGMLFAAGGTGGNASNAATGITGPNLGGTGAAAGSLLGGGNGQWFGATAGPSPFALTGPNRFGGGAPTGATGGLVTLNTLQLNAVAFNTITHPQSFVGWPALLSGGAGGGMQSFTGTAPGGPGGGGGVIYVATPLLTGSGHIDVSGGFSGNNTFGGISSGGGGAGAVIIHACTNSSTITYNVAGGRSVDSTSGSGFNSSAAGETGMVLFI